MQSPGKFNEVSALIEIAINYINKRSAEIGVTHVRMTPMVVQIDSSSAVESSAPSSQHQGSIQEQPQQQQHQPQQQPQYQQQQTYNPRPNQGYAQPRNTVPPFNNGNNQQGSYRAPFRQPSQQQQQRYNSPPQGQQQQQRPGPGPNFTVGNCFKCNKPNHWATNCRSYATPFSFDRCCKFCSGYHTGRCVTLGPRQSQGSNSSNGRQSDNSRSNSNPHQQEQQRGREQAVAHVQHQNAGIGTGQALPGTAFLTSTRVSHNSN